jgi:hypothetical protein
MSTELELEQLEKQIDNIELEIMILRDNDDLEIDWVKIGILKDEQNFLLDRLNKLRTELHGY